MRCFTLLLLLLSTSVFAADGNRLTYLDEFTSPYHVGRDFPKLTTPQWVGEEGVDAVVVFAIDDMRDTGGYEAYLRPILDRLKKIDGRAPVSIMTCSVDPKNAQLQTWLKEGLTIEIHTVDHPCPLLNGGDFAKAKSTYDRCVDMMNEIPGNKPVAFRMPCCDSLNTPSPRFWSEIFNKTTAKGNFLTIDSSVFHVFTPKDKSLPRELVLEKDGSERFRKYIPFPSFVNWIEDYPYPYVIGRRCWQFPCVVPSDWEAQNLHRPFNPQTVEDMKAALDATVLKKGVYNLVFHPHGWIRNEQVIDLIDHAVKKHGKRVKFLTFREAQQRLDKHLLNGHPLRDPKTGAQNDVWLLDVNNDGYMDVVNSFKRKTRVWNPETNQWTETVFRSGVFTRTPGNNLPDMRFGVFREDGNASCYGYELLPEDPKQRTHWFYHFDGKEWQYDHNMFKGIGKMPNGKFVRLRDLDGDGKSELIDGETGRIMQWDQKAGRWNKLPFSLPKGLTLSDQDNGARFVDVNKDGRDDILFSNHERFSLHLFDSMETGWSAKVLDGKRGDEGSLPPLVRDDPKAANNGGWFHSDHLWFQNEDTNRLPNLVDRRSFADMLKVKANDDQANMPPPRSPADSLASIKTTPGYRIELVAAEPLVMDPVAFDWGTDGRLWVVEMGDYPNGTKWRGEGDPLGTPGGRVKVLSDTTGNGKFDKAELFLDKIPFPTGIKVWRKGVLVTAAPEIFYAEDTDGDGRADKRETLYRGFGEGNQQHRVNGLRWGLDNWLYVANGDSDGNIKSTKTDKVLSIGGRDLRIRPDEGLIDAQSGRTQFGRSRDDWGNWFGGNNSNPMWHYVLADHYLRRNPHVASPNIRTAVSIAPGAAPVYPISRTLARFNDFNGTNRFTSACSPIIYRDDLLFDATHSLVCEPVHNLIHREIVTPKGYSFTSRRPADEQHSEFLASSDNWFRPTMIRTGPDGALWFADMYRLVIEHPKWIPADWQKRLDLRAGTDRGRIYRIVPDNKKLRKVPQFDKLTTAELVATLESPNGWQRDTAQQLLLQKKDEAAVVPLEKMVREGKRPTARLHALCTLDGFGKLKPEVVVRAMFDKHPGVVRHALRISEPHLKTEFEIPVPPRGAYGDFPATRFKPRAGGLHSVGSFVHSVFESETKKRDPMVMLQLAYTLGELNGHKELAWLAREYQNDPVMMAAIRSSINEDNITDLIQQVLSRRPTSDKPLPNSFLQELYSLAVSLGDDETIQDVMTSLLNASPQRANGDQWRLVALAGMLDALNRRMKKFEDIVNENTAEQFEKLVSMIRKNLGEDAEGTPGVELVAGIQLLVRAPTINDSDIRLISTLLSARNPPQMQTVAADALARLGDERASQALLKEWHSHTPALRNQIAEILLSRPAWTNQLLDAVESNLVAPVQLSLAHRRTLLSSKNAAIQKRALKLLDATPINANRAKVIEEYRGGLKLTANVAAGKEHFRKRCSTCHRLGGVGQAHGPDLAALSNRSPDVLLTAILDPNRAIEDKYLVYQIITKDGRTLSGLLLNETTNSLTLQTTQNKKLDILRNEIDEIAASRLSFMPEGMEKELTHQSMADLIGYLQKVGPPPKSFPGNQSALVKPDDQGVLKLLATNCKIYGPSVVFEPQHKNLGYWASDRDLATWSVNVPKGTKYDVMMDYACSNDVAGNGFSIRIGQHVVNGQVEGTGSWSDYKKKNVATIELPSGIQTLEFRSIGPVKGFLIDLRGIELVPAK